ncbi:hypothetical protein [Clostridium baratii]|uniref:hypothetical protein n=1 Tax=Clostridium baratii TaxID=1561 RepID=UPI0005F2A020|nr:hypothetical protein [Clostridium baratii]KJU72390.1 hypothetical protein UC77_04465 [Clostridium baratii]
MLYKRKDERIEAIKWDGNNLKEVSRFVCGKRIIKHYNDSLEIITPDISFDLIVHIDDYITKDIAGNIGVKAEGLIEEFYEKIEEDEKIKKFNAYLSELKSEYKKAEVENDANKKQYYEGMIEGFLLARDIMKK